MRTSFCGSSTISVNVFPTTATTLPFCSLGSFSDRVNGVSSPGLYKSLESVLVLSYLIWYKNMSSGRELIWLFVILKQSWVDLSSKKTVVGCSRESNLLMTTTMTSKTDNLRLHRLFGKSQMSQTTHNSSSYPEIDNDNLKCALWRF